MSIGKDEESPWPPSQEASPDTAVLDFLSVIAENSLTEERSTGQWLTDLSGGTSRVNLDSFKKNVPQDANRNEGSVWLLHTSPCLASCFSPKGRCTGGFQPFAHQAVICYLSGRGKLWKGLPRSDPCLPPPHVPPCAGAALPHCRTFCSTSPWHRRLHLCLSLLSLLNQTGIFLSLVSSMWRMLPDKALLFYEWFWHRVSQATPTPKDTAPVATLTLTSPIKTSPWQPLCKVLPGDKDRPSAWVGAWMALQANRQQAGQDTTFSLSRGPGNRNAAQQHRTGQRGRQRQATLAPRAQPDLSLRMPPLQCSLLASPLRAVHGAHTHRCRHCNAVTSSYC